MNIIREDVDALNAVLKVKISAEDYQGKVKNALEKYRKTAKIPGFRPGYVPFGLIQKQYGKSVLAEELNKLANDGLYKFITDNNLEILGNPIPKAETEAVGDFDNPTDFEFAYEIGFSPTFEIPLNNKTKFDFASVNIDDALIHKQIEDLQRRYGKLVSSEEAGEKDMILGKFQELNADGTVNENGISHSTTISLEFVDNKEASKILVGKKIGDAFELDPEIVSKGSNDKAALLGVKPEDLETLTARFQFAITEIKRMELAELNEELFAKLFMDGEVTNVEELKKRVAEDLHKMFAGDSDRILTRDVYNYLLAETKIEFPTEFLKRWIKLSSEKPVADEDLDNEFDGYLKSLKWQLIQTKIFKDNNIQLNNEEVIAFAKGLVINNYAQYGLPAPDDSELNETVQRILKNREQANSIYDQLAEQKLTAYFKSTVKLNDKKVSYDEFVEIASRPN